MAGVALGRHRPPSVEHEVVAVRPDQRDPALELGRAQPSHRGEQPGGQPLAVGRLAGCGDPVLRRSARLAR